LEKFVKSKSTHKKSNKRALSSSGSYYEYYDSEEESVQRHEDEIAFRKFVEEYNAQI